MLWTRTGGCHHQPGDVDSAKLTASESWQCSKVHFKHCSIQHHLISELTKWGVAEMGKSWRESCNSVMFYKTCNSWVLCLVLRKTCSMPIMLTLALPTHGNLIHIFVSRINLRKSTIFVESRNNTLYGRQNIYIFKTVVCDRVFALYRPCAYPGVVLRHASGPTGPWNS